MITFLQDMIVLTLNNLSDKRYYHYLHTEGKENVNVSPPTA